MRAPGTCELCPIHCGEHGQVSRAIQRLAKPGIDVVLMDLILPDGRGIDALHKVIVHAPPNSNFGGQRLS